MKGECCLYGFYNNVAVAAQHALDKGVKKILIVDWDVYHGQASQKMFYDDPRYPIDLLCYKTFNSN